MPFGNSGKPRERVEADNKIKIPDNTRPGEIADVWCFSVDSEGKYSKELTDDQKVSIKVRFDSRPDIVLEKRMSAFLGKKAQFALLYEALTGGKYPAGSKELENRLLILDDKGRLDLAKVNRAMRDDLVGRGVLITTKYNAEKGYTNVATLTAEPTPEGEDDLASVPMQRNPGVSDKPLTQAQQASESHEGPSWDDLDSEVPF